MDLSSDHESGSTGIVEFAVLAPEPHAVVCTDDCEHACAMSVYLIEMII